MAFELIIERSGEASRVHRVTGDRATLGRKSASDLVLSASDVSKHHATVERRGGGYYLIDEGSRNGTHLGGERVEAHQPIALRDGDVVRIGSFLITLRLEDSSHGADWPEWSESRGANLETAVPGDPEPSGVSAQALPEPVSESTPGLEPGPEEARLEQEPSSRIPPSDRAVTEWLEQWVTGDRAEEAERRVPVVFEHLAAWFAAALERRAAVQEALSLDYSDALGKGDPARLTGIRSARDMIRTLLDPTGPLPGDRLLHAVREATAALAEQRIGEALGLDACLRSALGSLAPDGIRNRVESQPTESPPGASGGDDAEDARCWREYRRRFAILMDENGLVESRLNELFRDLFLDLQASDSDPA